jgi:hypothetical protein
MSFRRSSSLTKMVQCYGVRKTRDPRVSTRGGPRADPRRRTPPPQHCTCRGLWGLDLTSTLAPRLAASRPHTRVQCRTPWRHGGVSPAALKRREAGQGRSRARQPGAGAKGARQGRTRPLDPQIGLYMNITRHMTPGARECTSTQAAPLHRPAQPHPYSIRAYRPLDETHVEAHHLSGAPWSTVRTHRGKVAPSPSGRSIYIHTPASQASQRHR